MPFKTLFTAALLTLGGGAVSAQALLIHNARGLTLDERGRVDIPRLAKAQVIASVQPTHATSDMNMAEDRVGAQRIQGAYAWQRLLKGGARLACGSDFPVEEPSPWAGLHAAITREDAAGKPAGGWYRQQALTPVQALDCFTRGAAFAAHAEKDLGSLMPDHRADFILVDRDPLTSSPAGLLKTRVLQTWVGGKLVHKAEH